MNLGRINSGRSIVLDLSRLDFGIQGDETLDDKISLGQLGGIFCDFIVRGNNPE